jgi:VWFA-related protein
MKVRDAGISARPRHFSLLIATAMLGVAATATIARQTTENPSPAGTLRVDVDLVNLYCTVKDARGALVTDLGEQEFEVWEDGRKQKLRYFARETNRPLTLGLLMDTSGSQAAVLAAEKDIAAQFLRRVLRTSDLAMLMTFDVNVDLLQDFTSDAGRMERALRRAQINAPGSPVNPGPLPPSGPAGTRLFDAVYLGAKDKLGPETGRKALLVISDGLDRGSKVNIQQALAAAQRSDVIVYAIVVGDPAGYGNPQYKQQEWMEIGRKNLDLLATETGGRAYTVRSPDRLKDAFDQIAAELRSQYNLAYTPSSRVRDGHFRKLEVRVKRAGLRVQARRGYYAPQS